MRRHEWPKRFQPKNELIVCMGEEIVNRLGLDQLKIDIDPGATYVTESEGGNRILVTVSPRELKFVNSRHQVYMLAADIDENTGLLRPAVYAEFSGKKHPDFIGLGKLFIPAAVHFLGKFAKINGIYADWINGTKNWEQLKANLETMEFLDSIGNTYTGKLAKSLGFTHIHPQFSTQYGLPDRVNVIFRA